MTKLTTEELQQISNLKLDYDKIVESLGAVEAQIILFQEQKIQYKNSLLESKKQEMELYKNLETKYGIGTISLESGEFTPQK